MSSIRVEPLDTVVPPVGYVRVPIQAHSDAPGHVELPVAGAGASPPTQVTALCGVTLRPAVQSVHHQQVAFGVEGDSGGAVELAVAVAFPAPLGQELAGLAEDGHPMKRLVRDVHVLGFVQGYRGGPHEVAVARATGAELSQVLLVYGTHGDVLGQEPYLGIDVPTVHHVQDAVTAHGHVDRVVEPPAALPTTLEPDAVAISIRWPQLSRLR